jgi:hypothetical protein
VLGGVIDYRLAKRSERAEARAAARVLQVELWDAAAPLREAEEIGYWFVGTSVSVADAWREHRRVLASVLDTEPWQRLCTGIQALGQLQRQLRALGIDEDGQPRASPGDPLPIPKHTHERIMITGGLLAAAYSMLAPLAKTSPVSHLPPWKPSTHDEEDGT